ncbi:MAG: hypothetical protein IIU14_07040 [Ruminococcus sp.]|nr:hypothetical protein [Ruminococcus sp.]
MDNSNKITLLRGAGKELDEIAADISRESEFFKESAGDIKKALSLSSSDGLGGCFERLTDNMDDISSQLMSCAKELRGQSELSE